LIDGREREFEERLVLVEAGLECLHGTGQNGIVAEMVPVDCSSDEERMFVLVGS